MTQRMEGELTEHEQDVLAELQKISKTVKGINKNLKETLELLEQNDPSSSPAYKDIAKETLEKLKGVLQKLTTPSESSGLNNA